MVIWVFKFPKRATIFLAEHKCILRIFFVKVEKILKGSLDSIPSPSPSVKIQIMGGKGVKIKHC